MDVLMPQLGETVDQGKIIKWFKSIGDTVSPGDVLFEIETDKVSMEVPSVEGGPLTAIYVQSGESAPVGAVVCVVGGVSAAAASSTEAAPTRAAAPATSPSELALATAPIIKRDLDPFNAVVSPVRNFGSATLPSGAKVTPLARRLASQLDVDLSTLVGSGPHGRIVAKDVEDASRRTPAAATAAAPSPLQSASADQVRALYRDTPFEEIELDGMRRTIARRLVESKQTVPHFYLTADVVLEPLLQIRSQINAAGGIKISVNDFIVKAFAVALLKTPAANAAWADDRILRFTRADVGVAVSVEGGLFTPVVRSADSKTLSTLSLEIKDLAERARSRKLQPHEYQGGSAAVSNLGMFGVRAFSAIINPPQATILAVGAGERRPFEAEDGGVVFKSALTVTLSCDHRVVDGALGAELLGRFKTLIEAPLSILV